MFPRREILVDPTFPPLAEFWMPTAADTDEEGYGLYFRDVFPLLDVSVDDARGVLEWERVAVKWATLGARDETDFEAYAEVAESFYTDDEDPAQAGSTRLPPELEQSEYSLWDLDLGVSGLSHALAATGFCPVASCRSHQVRSWSLEPVVLFAAEEEMLHALQPLIAKSGCGLEADTSRGRPLFVVYSSSIFEMMDLAAKLLSSHLRFQRITRMAPKRNSFDQDSSGSQGQPKLS